MSAAPPNFDLLARAYRWLEYFTFGRSLERCRHHFLPTLGKCRHALVLGDGDGRFLARLMSRCLELRVDAVDSSAAMLNLLHQRCASEGPGAAARLRCHHADAVSFTCDLPDKKYDLIVTHFFFDCLDQESVDALARSVAKGAAPGAVWIVSDFRIPSGRKRIPARILVRALYVAFWILTGLTNRTLPDHEAALTRAGFTRTATRFSVAGLLFTERWHLPGD